MWDKPEKKLGLDTLKSPLLKAKSTERLTAQYLLANKWDLLAMNYRCVGSEIDIIAKKNNKIIFVEVKYRRGSYLIQDLVTKKKMRAMIVGANHFLMNLKTSSLNYHRFDLCVITKKEKVSYFEDIFTPLDCV